MLDLPDETEWWPRRNICDDDENAEENLCRMYGRKMTATDRRTRRLLQGALMVAEVMSAYVPGGDKPTF